MKGGVYRMLTNELAAMQKQTEDKTGRKGACMLPDIPHE